MYDEAYCRWARALLGSPSWRSGAVAAAELGWTLSGFGRAVLEVASRRARLWQLPPCDLYGDTFRVAHELSNSSWASRSSKLLKEWGLPDWPELGVLYQVCVGRVRKLVEGVCLTNLHRQLASHVCPCHSCLTLVVWPGIW